MRRDERDGGCAGNGAARLSRQRGERLRQELAALTGEELMQASGQLLVLDRLLERLFKLESRALIFSKFTQVMADGH